MFSKTTEYALRAVIYIAQESSETKKIGITAIANAIDSPKSFTAKILQVLTRDSRVVSSTPGPNGGFYMTDKARALPVYEILKVTGEDIVLNKCVLGLANCSEGKPCPMHSRYKFIKKELIQLFETETIGTLAENAKLGEVFIKN